MRLAAALTVARLAACALIPEDTSTTASSSSSSKVRFRGVTIPKPHSPQRRNVDSITANHIVMQKIPGHVPAPAWQKSLHKSLSDGWDLTAEPNGTVSTMSNLTYLYNTNYVVPITIGKQEFQVSVDTGSSDTWVINSNFSCIDPTYGYIQPEFCGFGPTFKGAFKYGNVPDVANFSFTYGDGTYVSGQAGYEDVTLAGVTVNKQQLLMTNEAAWVGDGITSGLLGLSYPLETRIYNSTGSGQNYVGSATQRKYDPVFTSMHKKGLISPLFSMAMNRTSQQGWLAFGGLPPVDHGSEFAKTPIRIVEVDNSPATRSENSYYTIIPDGVTYGRLNTSNFNYSNPSWNGLFSDTNRTQFPVMLDSGATYSYLPREIVLPYVRQFTPPVGRFRGQYWAPCNATVPPFGVTIGGKTFYLDNADLLEQEVRQEQSYNGLPVTVCLIGLMDNYPNGPFIFGDNFLNNFVTVFDVGGSEMRFYKRK